MPGTLLFETVGGARAGVRNILSLATALRGSDALAFNALQGMVSSILDSHRVQIRPVTDSAEAQANTIINRFLSGWGGNPHASLTAIAAAVVAFRGEAGTLLNTIADPVSVNGQGEIVYDVVDITDLHASLDTLITACAVLE
jgi:hypothetical protein